MLVSLTNYKIWAKSSPAKPPIIIVTYNREEAFKKSFFSISSTTNCPIYIIDNSCGKLDQALNWAKSLSKNVSIIKNDRNIGKAASIQKHYHSIISNTQWFLSIDPDIIVKENDIDNLINSANQLLSKGYPVSLLAPALNSGDNPISRQLENGELDTHKIGSMFHLEDDLYINEYLAGCLLLINSLFFKEIGGFTQQRIYGGDDGELSRLTKSNEMISVLDTSVECIHYRSDEPLEYVKWKKDNIRSQTIQKGYWD